MRPAETGSLFVPDDQDDLIFREQTDQSEESYRSAPAADAHRLPLSAQSSAPHKLHGRAHETITRLVLGRHAAQNNSSPPTVKGV